MHKGILSIIAVGAVRALWFCRTTGVSAAAANVR